MEPGTHQGGGCIVVIQDTADWAHAPIYILPFTVPRLAAELGGVPMTMELLGISAGLELLDALNLSGTVYSTAKALSVSFTIPTSYDGHRRDQAFL